MKPNVKFQVNNDPLNFTIPSQYSRIIGDKEYELKDHLGNVRVTLSDARENSTTAKVTSATSYLPFGMVEPNVFTSAGNHRFGFGGMEKDDEWKGDGNSLDFGARIYDPRIGRWLSRDAKESEYPGVSTYSYSYNNPLFYTDPDGNSIVSMIIKKAAKEGFKAAIKKVIKEVIEQKIKDYAKKGLKEKAKQFAKDAANIVDELETLDGAWWEVAIEFTPIFGDIYGGSKFAQQVSTILHKVDVLESKIDDALDASKKAEKAVESVGDKVDEAGEGIIYLRRDKTGKEKDYVGQAKSDKRFVERQKEHKRKNKDADYEFFELDRGKPGKDLNQKEQKQLDKRNGPTNKSNPNGGTSNKKNVIKKDNKAKNG